MNKILANKTLQERINIIWKNYLCLELKKQKYPYFLEIQRYIFHYLPDNLDQLIEIDMIMNNIKTMLDENDPNITSEIDQLLNSLKKSEKL